LVGGWGFNVDADDWGVDHLAGVLVACWMLDDFSVVVAAVCDWEAPINLRMNC
jgi:hypothetical protein